MKPTIVFLGDSITEAFDVKTLLSEFNIINKGIYGDNSMGVLDRIEKDAINLNPDYVFILIGTNDFALNRTPEQLADTYEKIIKRLAESMPSKNIYVTSILPTRNIENRPKEIITKANELLKKIASSYDANYFDLHSEFLASDGQIIADFTSDGLHLSEDGYKKWAEVFRKKFSFLAKD